MSFVLILYFALICSFADPAYSTPFEFTFYSEANARGIQQSITVSETQLDFNCAYSIVAPVKSYCYVGGWRIGGRASTYIPLVQSNRQCYNNQEGSVVNVTSIYRYGPEDTSIPAITIGGGSDFTVIEKIAEGNVNVTSGYIVVTDIYTTGFSEWTLFSGKNFEGNTSCVTSPQEINRYKATSFGLPSIGSVIRGCNLSQMDVRDVKKLYSFV